MQIYYRISDNSDDKHRMPGVTKALCLKNCLDTFDRANVTVFADNCNDDTLEMVKNTGVKFEESRNNDAGSLLKCLGRAIDTGGYVYFVEDDYLHHPDSAKILLEGFGYGEYVSLYDHPMKYGSQNSFAISAQVGRGQHSHWLLCHANCMTFATTANALKNDIDVFKDGCRECLPKQSIIWNRLFDRGKPIAVSVPGKAWHVDLTCYTVNGVVTAEKWATDLAVDALADELLAIHPELFSTVVWARSSSTDPLKMLEALVKLTTNESRASH